jgi:hypothetical protein
MNRFATHALPLFVSTLFALGAAGCGAEDPDPDPDLDSVLTVENQSSYTLISLYLSPTTSVQWGSDLLGEAVLEPGDRFEIGGIDCDTYDIRVVDEDDDECIIEDVDLCLDDAHWLIDDDELAGCTL